MSLHELLKLGSALAQVSGILHDGLPGGVTLELRIHDGADRWHFTSSESVGEFSDGSNLLRDWRIRPESFDGVAIGVSKSHVWLLILILRRGGLLGLPCGNLGVGGLVVRIVHRVESGLVLVLAAGDGAKLFGELLPQVRSRIEVFQFTCPFALQCLCHGVRGLPFTLAGHDEVDHRPGEGILPASGVVRLLQRAIPLGFVLPDVDFPLRERLAVRSPLADESEDVRHWRDASLVEDCGECFVNTTVEDGAGSGV